MPFSFATFAPGKTSPRLPLLPPAVVRVLLAGCATAPGILAAQKIASATDLAAARNAFKIVSKHAVALAAGHAGYYHAHCPMVPNDESDWVQSSKKISNPYFGKAMATCGSIEN